MIDMLIVLAVTNRGLCDSGLLFVRRVRLRRGFGAAIESQPATAAAVRPAAESSLNQGVKSVPFGAANVRRAAFRAFRRILDDFAFVRHEAKSVADRTNKDRPRAASARLNSTKNSTRTGYFSR